MKIVKRYYDATKEQWDEVDKEIQQEEESLTEEEQAARAIRNQKELREIYRKAYEYKKRWKRVSDKKKMRQFQFLSRQALWMAEYINANIVVDTDSRFLGKIILESKDFILPTNCNSVIRRIFADLFLMSNDTFIEGSSSLCKMEFWFDLYKEIPANRQ